MPSASVRSRVRMRHGPIADPLLAAAITTAFSLIVFGPLLAQIGDSWGPGDMLSHYVNVDTWAGFGHAVSTHYGFPLGMNQNLFPGVDITQNAIAATISAITGNPFTGLNVLIMLSFPLTAALAVVALRLVGLTGWWAIALGIAYTFIPYHWGRSLGHVYLGTMYAAVTGVILALLVGTGQVQRDRLTRGRIAAIAVLVLVTAWSNIYYAAFGLLLTLAAVLFRVLKGDDRKQLGYALLPSIAIAVTTIVGLIPAIIARASESGVAQLGSRAAYESVTLAGNLAMALIPAPVSQLPYMGYYNEAVYGLIDDAPPLENLSGTNFGTWVISAAAIYALLWWIVSLRRGAKIPDDFQLLALLTFVGGLFFVPWGLNALVAEFITAQIRAWNRMIPTLLLLLLLAGAAALRHSTWATRSRVSIIGPLVTLAVVLVEQVVPYRTVYSSTVDRYSQETQWARDYAVATNAAIPEECGILQIPRMIYPENGPVPPELNDYEHFWLPLTNRDKDFSFGAVVFTEADSVTAGIRGFPDPSAIAAFDDLGFCAVHVDIRGIEVNRRERLLTTLEAQLGEPVATGHEGDWFLYSFDSRPR